MMTGRTGKVGILVSGAIFIIIASALLATFTVRAKLSTQVSLYKGFEETESGWFYSDQIGSPAATPMIRAKVAISGPLGLSSKEVAYLIATKDNQGRPLLSQCVYEVSGGPFDTRWWSITLYDSDTQKYVPNSENRSSWNSVNLPADIDGNWSLTVAHDRKGDHWLPSQSEGDKAFELILRLYNPSPTIKAALPNITLPDVERVSC